MIKCEEVYWKTSTIKEWGWGWKGNIYGHKRTEVSVTIEFLFALRYFEQGSKKLYGLKRYSGHYIGRHKTDKALI